MPAQLTAVGAVKVRRPATAPIRNAGSRMIIVPSYARRLRSPLYCPSRIPAGSRRMMDGSSRCGVHRRPRYGTSMPGVGAIHPVKRTRLPAGAGWIRTFSSAVDWQQLVVSSELGRSTGARSSEQLPASANRSSYRTGSGAPHSPPGSGAVTPRSRCQRCERIADAKARISPPPASESALWLRVRRNLTHLFWIDH